MATCNRRRILALAQSGLDQECEHHPERRSTHALLSIAYINPNCVGLFDYISLGPSKILPKIYCWAHVHSPLHRNAT